MPKFGRSPRYAEQELLGAVRPLDRDAEFLPQLGGAAGMVDVAMGEPDFFHRHLGFGDRLAQARKSPPGSMTTARRVCRAPHQRAVLLKGGDRNDRGADVFHADLTDALPAPHLPAAALTSAISFHIP